MRIFEGVPWRGASNYSGLVRTCDFFGDFGRHIFGAFTAEANIITRRHEVHCRLSSDPKMIDLE